MSVELMTKEDLQQFRNDLLSEIRQILSVLPDKPKEWIKSADVKRLLKVSSGTLVNLRISGQLSFSKLGGTYYYRYADLIKMIEGSVKPSLR
ncbi:helix-turn-helix domain-containing protein [Mucilaginibacter terrae]|uniref:Helix-turn-helix domain-containing protein n=1 Tax=Mucilaginibacter terrae TaxID=1955052 RepID=A0ABU3GRB7_9SPHI|nr:helix-turn-helix domain-containing protein [Mucilaginibacter terrae]MDT3402328.1 hypothetical protein [Mucilaginibacter terrae]